MRERIHKLLAYYQINQTEFANRIGLSKAMVSHVMSPSGRGSSFTDDTIDKIMSAFPDLNRSWLVNGDGEMLQTSSNGPTQASFDFSEATSDNEAPVPAPKNDVKQDKQIVYDTHADEDERVAPVLREENEVIVNRNNAEVRKPSPSVNNEKPNVNQHVNAAVDNSKTVSKIVVFYTDGTFSLYTPDNTSF